MIEKDLKHTEFVIYCVETYKGKKNLEGKVAYQKLKEAGAIEYIDRNYEALHTFGDDAIVWNIDEYMSNRPSGTIK
jgi:hypothetical protein